MCVCVCVYRLELPKLCCHPGRRLMRLGYRTCFHTLYDEKKKKGLYADKARERDLYKQIGIYINK